MLTGAAPIRSRQNPTFKNLRQTGRSGHYADCFIAEGLRLVRTALESGVVPELLICSETFAHGKAAEASEIDSLTPSEAGRLLLADDLFAHITDTGTPQGILIVARRPDPARLDIPDDGKPVLILDRLQDPGNAGTLLRIAAAFDFGCVVLIEGSADPYGAKALRSGMGMTFQIPLISGISIQTAYGLLRERGYTIYCADLGGSDLATTEFRLPAALVLGNEGNGLSQEAREGADQAVTIPINSSVESLNAAAAGAVICYEIAKVSS